MKPESKRRSVLRREHGLEDCRDGTNKGWSDHTRKEFRRVKKADKYVFRKECSKMARKQDQRTNWKGTNNTGGNATSPLKETTGKRRFGQLLAKRGQRRAVYSV